EPRATAQASAQRAALEHRERRESGDGPTRLEGVMIDVPRIEIGGGGGVQHEIRRNSEAQDPPANGEGARAPPPRVPGARGPRRRAPSASLRARSTPRQRCDGRWPRQFPADRAAPARAIEPYFQSPPSAPTLSRR